MLNIFEWMKVPGGGHRSPVCARRIIEAWKFWAEALNNFFFFFLIWDFSMRFLATNVHECEAGVCFPSILSQIHDLENFRSRSARRRRVQVLALLTSTCQNLRRGTLGGWKLRVVPTSGWSGLQSCVRLRRP